MSEKKANIGAIVAWVALIGSECGAQIAMKLAGGSLDLTDGWAWALGAARSPWVWGAIGCYLIAFASWMLILRRSSLSLAFPVTGLVFVAVLAASRFLFDEAVDGWRLVGAAVILAGVAIMGGEGETAEPSKPL